MLASEGFDARLTGGGESKVKEIGALGIVRFSGRFIPMFVVSGETMIGLVARLTGGGRSLFVGEIWLVIPFHVDCCVISEFVTSLKCTRAD
jgi:hypothetical protein